MLIEVKWPTTQKIERFTQVKANQILTIREGDGDYCDSQAASNGLEFVIFLQVLEKSLPDDFCSGPARPGFSGSTTRNCLTSRL